MHDMRQRVIDKQERIQKLRNEVEALEEENKSAEVDLRYSQHFVSYMKENNSRVYKNKIEDYRKQSELVRIGRSALQNSGRIKFFHPSPTSEREHLLPRRMQANAAEKLYQGAIGRFSFRLRRISYRQTVLHKRLNDLEQKIFYIRHDLQNCLILGENCVNSTGVNVDTRYPNLSSDPYCEKEQITSEEMVDYVCHILRKIEARVMALGNGVSVRIAGKEKESDDVVEIMLKENVAEPNEFEDESSGQVLNKLPVFTEKEMRQKVAMMEASESEEKVAKIKKDLGEVPKRKLLLGEGSKLWNITGDRECKDGQDHPKVERESGQPIPVLSKLKENSVTISDIQDVREILNEKDKVIERVIEDVRMLRLEEEWHAHKDEINFNGTGELPDKRCYIPSIFAVVTHRGLLEVPNKADFDLLLSSGTHADFRNNWFQSATGVNSYTPKTFSESEMHTGPSEEKEKNPVNRSFRPPAGSNLNIYEDYVAGWFDSLNTRGTGSSENLDALIEVSESLPEETSADAAVSREIEHNLFIEEEMGDNITPEEMRDTVTPKEMRHTVTPKEMRHDITPVEI